MISNFAGVNAQMPPTNGYVGIRSLPSFPPSAVPMGMAQQSQIGSTMTQALPTIPPTQVPRPVMPVNTVTGSHSNTFGMRPAAPHTQNPPNPAQQNGVWTGQPPVGGAPTYPGGPLYTNSGGQTQLQQQIGPNSVITNTVQGSTPNMRMPLQTQSINAQTNYGHQPSGIRPPPALGSSSVTPGGPGIMATSSGAVNFGVQPLSQLAFSGGQINYGNGSSFIGMER